MTGPESAPKLPKVPGIMYLTPLHDAEGVPVRVPVWAGTDEEGYELLRTLPTDTDEQKLARRDLKSAMFMRTYSAGSSIVEQALEQAQATENDSERRGDATPEERALAKRIRANQAALDVPGEPTVRCHEGEPIVVVPWHRGLVPGHIYSPDGEREMNISQTCEYHFDQMFREGWHDPLTGEPGSMPAEDYDDYEDDVVSDLGEDQ